MLVESYKDIFIKNLRKYRIEKLANALQINPADFFIRDASKFSQKEEFPDIFSISQKLNSLPEIPKSSIIQLISDLSEKYSRQ